MHAPASICREETSASPAAATAGGASGSGDDAGRRPSRGALATVGSDETTGTGSVALPTGALRTGRFADPRGRGATEAEPGCAEAARADERGVAAEPALPGTVTIAAFEPRPPTEAGRSLAVTAGTSRARTRADGTGDGGTAVASLDAREAPSGSDSGEDVTDAVGSSLAAGGG
jgi:hypothetical protein